MDWLFKTREWLTWPDFLLRGDCQKISGWIVKLFSPFRGIMLYPSYNSRVFSWREVREEERQDLSVSVAEVGRVSFLTMQEGKHHLLVLLFLVLYISNFKDKQINSVPTIVSPYSPRPNIYSLSLPLLCPLTIVFLKIFSFEERQ